MKKSSMTLSSSKNEFLIKDGIWKNKKLWDLYEKAQTPFFMAKNFLNMQKKKRLKLLALHLTKKVFKF